jgi:multidrug transporter EmrE-like cation transporter
MKTSQIALILTSSLVSAVSTAVLRYALKDRFAWKGSLGILLKDTIQLLAEPIFLVAVAVFVLANLLWMLVLGSTKVAVAYPVQVGLVLCWNAILAYFVLSESLSTTGLFGLLLVVVGVVLLLI